MSVGVDALHDQKREEIELDFPGTCVFSSAMKLPIPWGHPMENFLI